MRQWDMTSEHLILLWNYTNSVIFITLPSRKWLSLPAATRLWLNFDQWCSRVHQVEVRVWVRVRVQVLCIRVRVWVWVLTKGLESKSLKIWTRVRREYYITDFDQLLMMMMMIMIMMVTAVVMMHILQWLGLHCRCTDGRCIQWLAVVITGQ